MVELQTDALLTLMGGVLPQACIMPPRKTGMYLVGGGVSYLLVL
jgi:hypothetical protein